MTVPPHSHSKRGVAIGSRRIQAIRRGCRYTGCPDYLGLKPNSGSRHCMNHVHSCEHRAQRPPQSAKHTNKQR